MFWSTALAQTTYERSREFDVDHVDSLSLHHIADLVRKEFQQESVLTFEYLPPTSAQADAVEVRVPGVDVQRLHDGLIADPAARNRLAGGSVTEQGTLILVAERADLPLVQRFIGELGGDWQAARTSYGTRQFVS